MAQSAKNVQKVLKMYIWGTCRSSRRISIGPCPWISRSTRWQKVPQNMLLGRGVGATKSFWGNQVLRRKATKSFGAVKSSSSKRAKSPKEPDFQSTEIEITSNFSAKLASYPMAMSSLRCHQCPVCPNNWRQGGTGNSGKRSAPGRASGIFLKKLINKEES